MTELEAVNEMLMSIGQSPVNTLAVTGIKDVSIAHQRLQSATRRVLTRGFAFNTDVNYPLSPDVDGVIIIPSNVLKVESMDSTELVMRRHPTKGMALYNKADRTFLFTTEVPLKIVWAFEFEDLPETARTYVATSAARRFQSKAIGSQILDRFEEEDEVRAWLLLEREERGSRKTNLFSSNRTMSTFGDRSH
jgi:hypothetical protein